VSFDFRQTFSTGVNDAVDEFSFNIAVGTIKQGASLEDWMRQSALDSSRFRSRKDAHINNLRGVTIHVAGQDEVIAHTLLLDGQTVFDFSYWKPESMTDFPVVVRQAYDSTFTTMVNSFRRF
jgi:hypothetical protein